MALGGGLGLTTAALDEARKLGGGVDGRHVAARRQGLRGRVSQGERGPGFEEMNAEEFVCSETRAEDCQDYVIIQ